MHARSVVSDVGVAVGAGCLLHDVATLGFGLALIRLWPIVALAAVAIVLWRTIGATVAAILVLVTVAIAAIVVCTVAVLMRIVVSLGCATVAIIVIAVVAGCLVISTILVIVSSLLSVLALMTITLMTMTLMTTMRSLLVLSDSSRVIVWLRMGSSGELASLRNGASSHNCLILVVSELCNLITLDPLTFS